MNRLIYKKIEILQSECRITEILSDTEYNIQAFKKGLSDEKNKLIVFCILCKIVYLYELNCIDDLINEWGVMYSLNILKGIVYGLFYTDDYLVISFKGTTTFRETINNLKFIQVDDKYCIPGKIHKGFHDSIFKNNVVETLEEKVFEILKNKKRKLYIIGHSLGGALATLFYSYLRNSALIHDQEIELITFGSPRVGDYEFSKCIDTSTRVVNGNDIVSKVPIFYYNHCEKLYHIGTSFSFNIITNHDISNYYKELKEKVVIKKH